MTRFLCATFFDPAPQMSTYDIASPATFDYGNVGAGVTGASADTGWNEHHSAKNRGIKGFVGGPDVWLYVAHDTIYRSDDAGATWAVVATLTDIDPAFSVMKSGFHVMQGATGTPTAFVFYLTSIPGEWGMAWSVDGEAWTVTGAIFAFGPGGTLGADPCVLDEIVFDNKLYLLAGSITDGKSPVFRLDPVLLTAAAVAQDDVIASNPGCLVQYGDKLYTVSYLAVDPPELRRVDDLSFSTAVVLLGSPPTTPTPGARWAAFVRADVDIDYYGAQLLWVIYYDGSGWHALKIDSVFTVVDKTADIIPAALASGLADSSRMIPRADYQAGLPLNPDIYLIHAEGGSGAELQEAWFFEGFSDELTSCGANGSSGLALASEITAMGGWHDWDDDSSRLSIEVVGRVAVAGGERFSLVLYSDSGTAPVDVGAWLQALDPHAVLELAATLIDPSAGGSLVADHVEGWLADNTTVREVTWSYADDGFVSASFRGILFYVQDA